ncbi:uncharacterized protein METZ01_LOCUS352459, partial [marine metagenome]
VKNTISIRNPKPAVPFALQEDWVEQPSAVVPVSGVYGVGVIGTYFTSIISCIATEIPVSILQNTHTFRRVDTGG